MFYGTTELNCVTCTMFTEMPAKSTCTLIGSPMALPLLVIMPHVNGGNDNENADPNQLQLLSRASEF